MSLTPEEKFKVIDWLSDEELEALKESREHAEAPICPYFKPQVFFFNFVPCQLLRFTEKLILIM